MMKIAGSFLKIQNNFEKIKKLDEVCDYIHFDVMDGQFTERPTLALSQMTSLKDLKKPIDVHLMVLDLKKYIDEVLEFKPEIITFHIEACKDVKGIIDYIHANKVKAGVAIDLDTDVNKVLPYLDDIDLVLVMSVKAGAGGQVYTDITDKLNKLYEYRSENGLSYLIEVDGGINDTTIGMLKKADIVVTGSYVTNAENYQSQIYKLKKVLRNGFTLAELLGVIVVLSILGLVAVTAIDNNIKKGRYDTCLVQEKNLTEGAKMLVTDYPNLLPSAGGVLEIPVNVLQDGGTLNSQVIDNGYIDDNLVNPMTDEPYVDSAGGVLVRVTTNNGSNFNYKVIYNDADEACHR